MGIPALAFRFSLSFAASLKRTDMSDIKSRVIAIIVDKLGVDQNEVNMEASFTNDLGADSLDTVELIMEFEKVNKEFHNGEERSRKFKYLH